MISAALEQDLSRGRMTLTQHSALFEDVEHVPMMLYASSGIATR